MSFGCKRRGIFQGKTGYGIMSEIIKFLRTLHVLMWIDE